MDPNAAARIIAIQQTMHAAMHDLVLQYVTLMQRCGVKSIPIHHV